MMLEEANARLKKMKITEEQLWGINSLYILLDLDKDDFCEIVDTVDEVKMEIKKALEALGYKNPDFEIATASFHRVVVWVGDVTVGIYDMDKHTFVD